MSWFDKWLKKKFIEAWNSGSDDTQVSTDREVKLRRGIPINSRRSDYDGASELSATGMRFHLYKAVGGHILETHVYNSRNDENEHTLYMINDDDDFAKQVAQAIMMEQMKL